MIVVSIVSHGHIQMLPFLLGQLLKFSEVEKIILTLNIPESINISDNRIQIICNETPMGFGANHNQAFSYCESEFFCVLNPDISFDHNAFAQLLKSDLVDKIGLIAPIVKNLDGDIEDSVRKFPSPSSILYRRLFGYRDGYSYSLGDANFYAEWVGGMFMLFKSHAFKTVRGFDEAYYLYVEDVDISTRLWGAGYKVLVCPNVVVLHDARRASRRNFKHLCWHISGLLRYFYKYLGRFPKAC